MYRREAFKLWTLASSKRSGRPVEGPGAEEFGWSDMVAMKAVGFHSMNCFEISQASVSL